MTVGEVKNMFKNQYADVEYYRKHVWRSTSNWFQFRALHRCGC